LPSRQVASLTTNSYICAQKTTTALPFSTRLVFTLATQPTLRNAHLLGESLQKHAPSVSFIIVLIDVLPTDYQGFKMLSVHSLAIDNWSEMVQRYYTDELVNACVPAAFQYFLKESPQVWYFEAHTWALGPLEALFSSLDQHPAVVLPQVTQPFVHQQPDDKFFLHTGLLSGQMVGFANHPESIRFLGWWQQRCAHSGQYDLAKGYGSAQLWLIHIFSFLPTIFLFKNIAYNIHLFNAAERGDTPPVLVNFNENIAQRFWVKNIPLALRGLYRQYQTQVQSFPTRSGPAWGRGQALSRSQARRQEWIRRLQGWKEWLMTYNPSWLQR
jgi:hypothetical protein